MDPIKPGYSRVTDILSLWNTNVVNEEGDIVAKIFQGSKIPIDIEILENKGNIGTNVHTAIDAYLTEGLEIPLRIPERGYFDSFHKWYKETGCEVVENEKRYYCDKLMITGAIDALVRLPGEEDLILVDFKTSASESPKIWPLQATFYHYLVSQTGIKLSPRLIFLKLDKHGEDPVVCEYTYSTQLLQVCKAAWVCHQYANN